VEVFAWWLNIQFGLSYRCGAAIN